MKRMTAKNLGYKVIDEFENNIASIVYLDFTNHEVIVIDEFDCDITKRVKIVKEAK